MCMRGTEQECVLADQQRQLQAKVAGMDERLTNVEAAVDKVRTEAQSGFRQGAEAMRAINESVANLAHDFAQRFNNMESTVVAEKVEWGKTLRKIALWSAMVLLSGCAVAMGVTIYKNFFLQ